MDFNGKAVLVYLEEDNITKAYFRIKPLLMENGPVGSDVLASLPDEGFLRIVPDRNEQHTFKERMRTMCGLCMLDLRNQPPEANKIRTNKNYSPTNGENNQYIVYSDAVQKIEADLFYQVVAIGDVEKAVTPSVYVRSGANMHGPFKKDEPISLENAKQLPPDSQGIFAISVNNQDMLFYWPLAIAVKEEKEELMPEAEPVSIPEEKKEQPISALEQIQEINKAFVNQTTNRLSSSPAPYIPQPQQPLNGTKLYAVGTKNNNYRRVHNPLIETVEMQRYAAKQEAPGAVVSDCGALKDIENPIDAFKVSLQKVCLTPEDSKQAVNIILSCPGMQKALSDAASGENKPLAASAMNLQLQEMEAERLMLLMQLDDAKKDMASLKKTALEELAASEKKEIERLSEQKAKLSDENALQNQALQAINEKRAQSNEVLNRAMNDGRSILLCKPVGQVMDKNTLTIRLQKAFQAAGFVCSEDDALAILTAFALSKHALQFCANTDADAHLAVLVLANVFGAPSAIFTDERNVLLAPGGNTPAFVRGNLRADATTAILPCDLKNSNPIQTEVPCALLPFVADTNSIPVPYAIEGAVSTASLDAFVQESKLTDVTLQIIHKLRMVDDHSLPLSVISNVVRFIASTQNGFKGGVAEAIDRAVLMFVLPYYQAVNISKESLASAIDTLPRAQKMWDEMK